MDNKEGKIFSTVDPSLVTSFFVFHNLSLQFKVSQLQCLIEYSLFIAITVLSFYTH